MQKKCSRAWQGRVGAENICEKTALNILANKILVKQNSQHVSGNLVLLFVRSKRLLKNVWHISSEKQFITRNCNLMQWNRGGFAAFNGRDIV